MKIAPTLLLAVSCAVAAGSAATAAPLSKKDEAKAEFDKAEISYKLGHFQEALDAYSRAFRIFQAPALLFNIGQCHRNLHNYDAAIFSFERYLREETNPSRRKFAQQLVAELREALAKQQAEAPAPPPAVAPTPPPALEVAPVQRPLAAVEPPAPSVVPAPTLLAARTDAADERPDAKPFTQRWWFWTAVGVGVAALAAGAFVYYESGSTNLILPGGTIGTLDRR